MGWASKALQKERNKEKMKKILDELQKTPSWKKIEERIYGEAVEKTFPSWLLISADFLLSEKNVGVDGINEYLEWVVKQLKYIEEDPTYYYWLNVDIRDRTGGLDILEYAAGNDVKNLLKNSVIMDEKGREKV